MKVDLKGYENHPVIELEKDHLSAHKNNLQYAASLRIVDN